MDVFRRIAHRSDILSDVYDRTVLLFLCRSDAASACAGAVWYRVWFFGGDAQRNKHDHEGAVHYFCGHDGNFPDFDRYRLPAGNDLHRVPCQRSVLPVPGGDRHDDQAGSVEHWHDLYCGAACSDRYAGCPDAVPCGNEYASDQYHWSAAVYRDHGMGCAENESDHGQHVGHDAGEVRDLHGSGAVSGFYQYFPLYSPSAWQQ